jgi:hypothetical protein
MRMHQKDIDRRVKTAGIVAFIICGLSILTAFAGLGYMILEALIAGFCGYFMWKKYSRTASTILFGDHALGALIMIISGELTLVMIIIKVIIIFVLWRGMMATYEYHKPIELTAELAE